MWLVQVGHEHVWSTLFPSERFGACSVMPPRNILIIHSHWAWRVVKGVKTWEIRGTGSKKRGRIGIAIPKHQGKTAQIIGEVTISDSFKVGVRRKDFITAPTESSNNYLFLENHVHKHCLTYDDFALFPNYKNIFAWVFEDAVEYDVPVPLPEKRGRVSWAIFGWSVTYHVTCRPGKKGFGPASEECGSDTAWDTSF